MRQYLHYAFSVDSFSVWEFFWLVVMGSPCNEPFAASFLRPYSLDIVGFVDPLPMHGGGQVSTCDKDHEGN